MHTPEGAREPCTGKPTCTPLFTFQKAFRNLLPRVTADIASCSWPGARALCRAGLSVKRRDGDAGKRSLGGGGGGGGAGLGRLYTAGRLAAAWVSKGPAATAATGITVN